MAQDTYRLPKCVGTWQLLFCDNQNTLYTAKIFNLSYSLCTTVSGIFNLNRKITQAFWLINVYSTYIIVQFETHHNPIAPPTLWQRNKKHTFLWCGIAKNVCVCIHISGLSRTQFHSAGSHIPHSTCGCGSVDTQTFLSKLLCLLTIIFHFYSWVELVQWGLCACMRYIYIYKGWAALRLMESRRIIAPGISKTLCQAFHFFQVVVLLRMYNS